MNDDSFFHTFAQAVKDVATYSPRINAWVISVDRLRMVLHDVSAIRPSDILPSYVLILEEGARRGLWKADYHHGHLTDVAVIRQPVHAK
jgi:hypothetical protein